MKQEVGVCGEDGGPSKLDILADVANLHGNQVVDGFVEVAGLPVALLVGEDNEER